MKKKYLLIIPSLVGSGAERVMTTLANYLSNDSEIKIVTISPHECFYKLNSNIDVYCTNCIIDRKNKITLMYSELKGSIKSINYFNKVVKQWKPDSIVVFLHEAILLALFGKILFRWKCKLIVSERGDPNKRSRCNVLLEKKMYPMADVIVCQSKNVARFFDSSTQNKIVVIPNPINPEAIPERFTGVRRKTIVAVGRLFPQKNYPLLLRAFEKLSKDYSEYNLEIYGEGYQREELERLICDLNLKQKARLMGLRKNVMHYISDVALFVLASDFEGFPNVLVEAMATGLPVVSTDFTPGIARDIVKEENGIVVPVNDVNSLYNAMKKILDCPEDAARMSVENRKILYILDEKKICGKWKSLL